MANFAEIDCGGREVLYKQTKIPPPPPPIKTLQPKLMGRMSLTQLTGAPTRTYDVLTYVS